MSLADLLAGLWLSVADRFERHRAVACFLLFAGLIAAAIALFGV